MYQPTTKILDKYADVLLNFGLNGGKGIKKGEVVFLQVPEVAKPLLICLRRAALKAGAHPMVQFIPDGMEREFFETASDSQIKFFPSKFMRGKIDQADHNLWVIAETDKHELEGIDPKKIMDVRKSMKPYIDWQDTKEAKGKFSWTLGLYGTEAMAKEVGLSLKKYWQEIIKACFLDNPNPVSRWRRSFAQVERVKEKLNGLRIKKLRVKAKDTDLTINIGDNRRWMGGSGANIPSFEIFISPDWRGTEGHISFDQPLYRYGNLIKEVYLEFKNGRVVKARAKKGEKVLREMIKVSNADKVGEYSLTDSRLSRITKFMAETLYDENVGGRYGNTHLALGSAYKDSYPGDPGKVSKKRWNQMGYNDSVVHTDIISRTNRVVTATLADGSENVIYEDGKFTI